MLGWSPIPRAMNGGRIFIIGGGPSAKGLDWELLRGRNVLACNAAAFLLPQGIAKWAVFSDRPFLRSFRTQLRAFVDGGGTLFNTPTPGKPIREKDHWMLHIQRLNGRKNWGISEDPNVVRWNKSTGGCAVNIAYLLGATEIVLVGFDMKAQGKAHNWHDAYEPCYTEGKQGWPSRPPVNHYRTAGMILAFDRIAEDLDRLGVRCWSTCEDSALTVFPYQPIEELL